MKTAKNPGKGATCPGCAKELGAGDVGNEKGFAVCKKCQALFVAPEGEAFDAAGPFLRAIERPASLVVAEEGGGVSVAWRYDRGRWPRMAFLSLLLLGGGGTLLWYFFTQGHAVWSILLGIPLVLLGVPVTYTLILLLLQWQRLEVKGKKLIVRSLPVPAPGGYTELDGATLDGVFARLRLVPVGRAKEGQSAPVYAFYDVMVRDGGRQMPIGTLMEPERAVYAAREIDGALKSARAGSSDG